MSRYFRALLTQQRALKIAAPTQAILQRRQKSLPACIQVACPKQKKSSATNGIFTGGVYVMPLPRIQLGQDFSRSMGSSSSGYRAAFLPSLQTYSRSRYSILRFRLASIRICRPSSFSVVSEPHNFPLKFVPPSAPRDCAKARSPLAPR